MSQENDSPPNLNDLLTVGNEPEETEETTPAKAEPEKGKEKPADEEGTPPEKTEKPKAKKEPEEKASKRRYKVKGEEREFDDEEIQQALNERELASHSKRRLTEAAEKEKRAEFILSRVIEDPISAFIELEAGRSGDETKAIEAALRKTEAFYEEVLKLQGASKEEREKLEAERQLKLERAKNERYEKAERNAKEEKEWTALEDEFLGEFEKEAVQNDSLSLRFLQEAYQEAIEDEKPITPRQAVRRGKEIRRAFEDALLQGLSPEELRTRAPGKAKELREHELQEFKAAQKTRAQSSTPGPSRTPAPREPRRTVPKAMSMAEMEVELARSI